ncbi:MAG: outer membrane protein assembly factor BamB family protein [Pirellulales bacterium]
MGLRRQVGCAANAAVIAGLVLPLGLAASAQGQFGSTTARFELSEAVRLDEPDTSTRTRLEQVKAHLVGRQWDEAVETLRQVMETHGDQVIRWTDRQYVSVRDYCHHQIVSLPPEGLRLYRKRIDPLARSWYEEGIARRDREILTRVVDQFFASSWGDQALYALGELALEEGDYDAARSDWERLVPPPRATVEAVPWLAYPDTDLNLADIRARLVLVSIREGSLARAEGELKDLVRLHPNARGRLGGRTAKYAEELAALIDEARKAPASEAGGDWPTFAGSPERNRAVPRGVDAGAVEWTVALTPEVAAGTGDEPSDRPRGVADNRVAPLSFYPLVVGRLVLVNREHDILAFDLATGKPAWGQQGGVIYRDELDTPSPERSAVLGVPRFTMTAYGDRLYARMGSWVAGRIQGTSIRSDASYLVCLDLAAQGRLEWRIAPEEGTGEGRWAFEGSPLSDGVNVYVAMRYSDVRPQAHVACFDAKTGRLRWRRFVCAAESPGRGMFEEAAHNLLTLHGETIYYNTNLGAVAAISTRDGRTRWVSLYPRAKLWDLNKPAEHASRDLTPCLYWQGMVFVAPSDSEEVLAMDAGSGQIAWRTAAAPDAVQLLGVGGGNLLADGNRLYGIDIATGRVAFRWPDSGEKLGYGRGILAGGMVYWPERDKIGLFDPKTGLQKGIIPLGEDRRTTGGNLVVADGWLLIATGRSLSAFGERSRVRSKE